jgi:hypothetical protein
LKRSIAHRVFFFILLLLLSLGGKAQLKNPTFWKPDTAFNKARSNLGWYGGGGAAALSLAGLYSIWYLDYPQSELHSTDDWENWLQMDKVGHMTVAYVVGENAYDAFKWAGNTERKAVWVGGSVGWAYLTVVEIMDGLSSGWGWSWGDFAFNTAGAGLFIGQQLGWKEQRMMLKFSYHSTEHPQYNPELLGSGGLESVIKNYNGQTYWLSVNPRSFTKERMGWWPKWLNVAGGYSADGMIDAKQTPREVLLGFERQRQYYLSLDID